MSDAAGDNNAFQLAAPESKSRDFCYPLRDDYPSQTAPAVSLRLIGPIGDKIAEASETALLKALILSYTLPRQVMLFKSSHPQKASL